MGAGSGRLVTVAVAGAIAGLACASAAEPAPAWRACERGVCWSIADGAIARVEGGRLEVRRPPLLADAHVDAAAAHGGTLWLGLSAERGGETVPLGLVRYDWDRDAARAFRGADTGPCGFFIREVSVVDGTLWVGTDLGVSRLALAAEWDEWTHFAATGDAIEETACATLLAAALEGGDAVVRKRVAEFRPRFWRRRRR